MDEIFAFDWEKLFVPSGSILEIFVRGTVMYLALFFLLRLILKRESGMVGITDILVIVLIADAAQNGMAGQYHSITEGFLLVSTIVFWSWFLEWLGFKSARVERILEPPPLLLVKDGRMLKENMKKELMTEVELKSLLRLKGVAKVEDVKQACMEPNGELSIIRKDGGETGRRGRRAV